MKLSLIIFFTYFACAFFLSLPLLLPLCYAYTRGPLLSALLAYVANPAAVCRLCPFDFFILICFIICLIFFC